MSNFISTYGSLKNMKFNEDLKKKAEEILTEEEHEKFMKSYRFMFWFQLSGFIFGFALPFAILPFFTNNFEYIIAGDVAFGLPCGILCLIVSMFLPQGRIYRKFSKLYRKDPVRMENVNDIFYSKKTKDIKVSTESLHIPEYVKQNFEMKIDGIFSIIGRGTVVTGTIISGMCTNGDYVTIKKSHGKNIDTVITNIELGKERQTCSYAHINESVGLTLRGITKEQVSIGDIVIRKII